MIYGGHEIDLLLVSPCQVFGLWDVGFIASPFQGEELEMWSSTFTQFH